LIWTLEQQAGMTDRPSNAAQAAQTADENLFPALLHLVERPDLRHPGLDLALRRGRRPGRVRQLLFPHRRRQDRSYAADGAALGHLQRRGRGVVHSAVVAWLDAPHRRRAADRGALPAATLAKAAPSEPH